MQTRGKLDLVGSLVGLVAVVLHLSGCACGKSDRVSPGVRLGEGEIPHTCAPSQSGNSMQASQGEQLPPILNQFDRDVELLTILAGKSDRTLYKKIDVFLRRWFSEDLLSEPLKAHGYLDAGNPNDTVLVSGYFGLEAEVSELRRFQSMYSEARLIDEAGKEVSDFYFLGVGSPLAEIPKLVDSYILKLQTE